MALRSAASDALIAPSEGVELPELLGGREVPDVAGVPVDEWWPLAVVGLLVVELLMPTDVVVFEVVTDELTVEGATDGPDVTELSDGREDVDPPEDAPVLVDSVRTCSLGSIDTRLVSEVGPLEELFEHPPSTKTQAIPTAALRLVLDLIDTPKYSISSVQCSRPGRRARKVVHNGSR